MSKVIRVKDLEEVFCIKYDKACQMMREIKSISDIAGIKGRILEEDFEAWKNYRRELKNGSKN